MQTLKIYITILFFIGSFTSIFGQFRSGDARIMGLGSSGLAIQDIHSLWTNPAGLAFLESFGGSAFAAQPFLISEIQTVGVGAAYPTTFGTFGISVNHLGFEQFRQQKAGLIYARQLANRLSIGAQFLALHTNVPEYGSKTVFTFEVGSIYRLLPQLDIAAHIYSPVRIELNNLETIPTLVSLGIGYHPSNQVLFLLEVEKDIDYKASVKTGVEYYVVEAFAIRAGVSTEPTSVHFGLGYRLENGLALDVASKYHQSLGFTPGFSVRYQITNKVN